MPAVGTPTEGVLRRFAVLAESASGPAIAFALIPVVASTLGVVGLGHFIIVQSLLVVVGVTTAGLVAASMTASAVAHEALAPSRARVAASGLCALSWCAFVCLFAALLSLYQGTDLRFGSVRTIQLALVLGGLQVLGTVIVAQLKGRERFVEAASLELGARCATYGALVASLLLTDVPSLERALGWAVSVETTSLVMRAIVVRSIVGPGSLVASGALPELRWVLHFARGVWAQSAAGLAFNTLDKFLVGVVGGAAILGGYGALVQLTSLIHFVPASVATVHTPRLIQTARDDESSVRFESLLQRLSREINLIVIALSVTVSVLGFFVWRFSLWPLLPLSEYWWTAVLIYVAYIVLAKAISCHSQLIAYGMTSSIGRVTLIAAALSSMTLCIGWMIESVLLLAVSRLVFSMAILIGWHQATKVRSLS